MYAKVANIGQIDSVFTNHKFNRSYPQPPKVCQRFILKPETPHIVCMRSIPGIIEETKMDWASSGLQLTGSSGSGSQHKLSSEVLPSKGGSLDHGKMSADFGPLDLESVKSTSSGKNNRFVT